MDTNLISDTIGLLIVMYNPIDSDIANVEAIAQCYKGIVVDNSQERNFATDHIGNMAYVPLYDNTGIANAQNIGLKHLISDQDITHVVFFDQDSRCSHDIPLMMQNEYLRVKAKVKNLALLGPIAVEQDTQEEYKSVVHKSACGEDGFEPRRDIISSGSIVDVDTLRSVGLMLSSLFIDFVDFEWCWRAKHKGYVCGVTHNVKLSHKVGCARLSFGHYKVLVWSPFRYFYQCRNYVWLSTLAYVPVQWKFATAVKYVARFFYLPFAVNNGGRCWMSMLKGLSFAFKGFRGFRREVDAYV